MANTEARSQHHHMELASVRHRSATNLCMHTQSPSCRSVKHCKHCVRPLRMHSLDKFCALCCTERPRTRAEQVRRQRVPGHQVRVHGPRLQRRSEVTGSHVSQGRCLAGHAPVSSQSGGDTVVQTVAARSHRCRALLLSCACWMSEHFDTKHGCRDCLRNCCEHLCCW